MGTAAEWITIQGRFSQKACAACGMLFYIPSNIEARCADEGRGWWCPGCGHSWCYGDTEADKLRKQLESERKRVEWKDEEIRRQDEEIRRQRERADHEERRGKAYKGHATRLRKRVSEGKCPCCSQHFADLETHITEKHPKYKPKDDETS